MNSSTKRGGGTGIYSGGKNIFGGSINTPKIEFGQSGYVDFSERKEIQPTVFSKYGNKIFMILILLYIFLIFSFNRFNNE